MVISFHPIQLDHLDNQGLSIHTPVFTRDMNRIAGPDRKVNHVGVGPVHVSGGEIVLTGCTSGAGVRLWRVKGVVPIEVCQYPFVACR